MKKLAFILLMIFLCGCAKGNDSYANIQDRLMQMKSYKTDAEITYINNRSKDTFSTVQQVKSDGRYRIETTAPDEFKDNVIVYDGKMIWQFNPKAPDNKVKTASSDKSERTELLLFSFLENMTKTAEAAVKSDDMGHYTVLEADIESKNGFLAYEKLWIDNSTGLPEKLVIYNSQGDEKIVELFGNFEYNYIIEDEAAVFSVNK